MYTRAVVLYRVVRGNNRSAHAIDSAFVFYDFRLPMYSVERITLYKREENYGIIMRASYYNII